MTEEKQYWPIEEGQLALGLVGNLMRALNNKGVLDASEIMGVINSTIGDGQSPKEDTARHLMRKLLPEIASRI